MSSDDGLCHSELTIRLLHTNFDVDKNGYCLDFYEPSILRPYPGPGSGRAYIRLAEPLEQRYYVLMNIALARLSAEQYQNFTLEWPKLTPVKHHPDGSCTFSMKKMFQPVNLVYANCVKKDLHEDAEALKPFVTKQQGTWLHIGYILVDNANIMFGSRNAHMEGTSNVLDLEFGLMAQQKLRTFLGIPYISTGNSNKNKSLRI